MPRLRAGEVKMMMYSSTLTTWDVGVTSLRYEHYTVHCVTGMTVGITYPNNVLNYSTTCIYFILGRLTQKTLNTRFNPTTISLNKTINKHVINCYQTLKEHLMYCASKLSMNIIIGGFGLTRVWIGEFPTVLLWP